MAIEPIYIGNEIANTDTLRDGFDKVNANTNELDVTKVPYSGARTNVDLGENQLKATQIEFDQTPSISGGVGIMRWNDTDGTLDLGLKGGNVTLQVGQEQLVRVVNKASIDLLEANYQAVKIIGATGQRLSIDLAQADSDANSATTIGIVTETINKNQEGFVTTSGQVREIDTTGSLQSETWADGDTLYLSPITAGQITNVKPIAPQHLIVIGYVEYAHAIHGKIFVKVDNGYEIDELHNVLITTPSNDQVLTYESATSLWKNKTLATGITVGSTSVTSGIDGRLFFQASSTIQQSANLFWDNTNIRLGIGTSSPSGRFHVAAQGALSTDIVARFRNSANTGDLLNVLGNGNVQVGVGGLSICRTDSPNGSLVGTINYQTNGAIRINLPIEVSGTYGRTGYSNTQVALDLQYAQANLRCYGGAANTGFTFNTIVATTGMYYMRLQNGGNDFLNISSGGGFIFTNSAVGSYAQPVASAKVQIDSTTQGFLPPRMTNAQRTAIASPVVGLMVYCTDMVEGLYIYKSIGWTFII